MENYHLLHIAEDKNIMYDELTKRHKSEELWSELVYLCRNWKFIEFDERIDWIWKNMIHCIFPLTKNIINKNSSHRPKMKNHDIVLSNDEDNRTQWTFMSKLTKYGKFHLFILLITEKHYVCGFDL